MYLGAYAVAFQASPLPVVQASHVDAGLIPDFPASDPASAYDQETLPRMAQIRVSLNPCEGTQRKILVLPWGQPSSGHYSSLEISKTFSLWLSFYLSRMSFKLKKKKTLKK